MDQNTKAKKPFFKRAWVWIGIVIITIAIIAIASGGNKKDEPSQQPATTTDSQPAASDPEPAKWDVEAAYAKIATGMSKAEVEAATGKPSESCTESEIEMIGKTEICTYGNAFTDKAAIMVTYGNGAVSSKTKSTY